MLRIVLREALAGLGPARLDDLREASGAATARRDDDAMSPPMTYASVSVFMCVMREPHWSCSAPMRRGRDDVDRAARERREDLVDRELLRRDAADGRVELRA